MSRWSRCASLWVTGECACAEQPNGLGVAIEPRKTGASLDPSRACETLMKSLWLSRPTRSVVTLISLMAELRQEVSAARTRHAALASGPTRDLVRRSAFLPHEVIVSRPPSVSSVQFPRRRQPLPQEDVGMHSRHTFKVALPVALWCTLFIAACTNCRDRVVQRANGGYLEATVHERVCGSVAGLTVRVAPSGTVEQEGDAFEFEPFQSRCAPSALNQASVSVTWT